MWRVWGWTRVRACARPGIGGNRKWSQGREEGKAWRRGRSCSEVLGVLSWETWFPALGHPLVVTCCITPSLHKRCWELGSSGVQSCVAPASLEKRPELPAPLFSPLLPPGVLHSEWQDHREEGCCCTVWGLLPHHRNAELWGESQSGPAPLEWLGTFPVHQPLLPLLPLYRTRYPVPDFPEDFFT